jgi:drug/metabolite transporter (DMT)-like permease
MCAIWCIGRLEIKSKIPIGDKGDNIALAIGAILLSVFALSLGNATIKLVSVDFVLWQIFIVRSALAIPVVILVIKLRHKGMPIRPRVELMPVLRTLMLSSMWVTYYIALPHVDLSIAAAGYYTLPIFITLFAALFIGDTVGTKGWLAVFLGFGGVILILGPQADDLNFYMLLPMVSAVLFALAMIITRTKCRNDNALMLSLELNIAFVVVGVLGAAVTHFWVATESEVARNLFLFGAWTPMGVVEWVVLGLLAIAATVGSVAAAVAYQNGPPATVAIFDFAYVGFAAIWGFLLFAEVPTLFTVCGIVLIIGAGVLATRR